MKRKVILILLSIAILLVGTTGVTYALWYYNKAQDTNNLLTSGCFKLELTDEKNNISLQNTIPLTNNEGMKLVPYTFKIKNTCSTVASYDVNLETLTKSTLSSNYIRASLNGDESKLLTEYDLMSSSILEDAKEGRTLTSGILKPGKTKSYNLRVWLDGNTTAISDALGKSFSSKITVTGVLNPNTITITLDPNGGELATNTLVEILGDKYSSLPTPSKEGYYFNYWYLDNDDNKITTNTIVEKNTNHTLKASWLSSDETAVLKENAFYNNLNSNITEIKFYNNVPTSEIISNATIISDDSSHNKAYAWNNETTMYYWSSANILMQNDKFNASEMLTSIDLTHLNTVLVTNMKGMFENCYNLTSIDLSNFNTSNVRDMSYMFNYCDSLASIDLSSFNTANVTNMEYMFSCSRNLISLNLRSFNTSNVINMSNMFSSCHSLDSLDLSNFDTSNVTLMNNMFKYCWAIYCIDLSNFDTSNVTDMYSMFIECENLISLDLSNFDTSKVNRFEYIFSSCEKLTNIILNCDVGSTLNDYITSKYSNISVTCI